MKHSRWVFAISFFFAAPAFAQSVSLEEVVVTGARSAEVRLPATSVKRQADFLLLQVEVSNDSRDRKLRRDEIYTTLRAMMDAAARDKSIELSVIREDNIVLPFKLTDATLGFRESSGDSLSTTISVKTPIDPAVTNGAILVEKLKDFAAGIKTAGRTVLLDDNETQVSVVNIAQYRDQVIQLFSGDVKKVTAALGGDYRVVVRGLDQPIRWVRDGTLGVIIFVPYAYDIVPTTISSYTPGGPPGGYGHDD
jgi:hypothetical protein